MPKKKNKMRPVHPGEILAEEYLGPLEMSANKFCDLIGVPTNRITEIIAGNRSVTADTALRLARVFDTTPEFWLALQQAYDLRVAETDPKLAGDLQAIKPLLKAG